LDRRRKKLHPWALEAASMQEKVATKQHGTRIADEDFVINPQNTCIDDRNWVMSEEKTCNHGRLAIHRRSDFLKQSSCRRHASRYPLQRRNLLLQFRHPHHRWRRKKEKRGRSQLRRFNWLRPLFFVADAVAQRAVVRRGAK
jgi:hypothetical protein